MIDRPPEYCLTCNCGMRVSGTNENGVISLMRKHIESGRFHASYIERGKFTIGDSALEQMLEAIPSTKKEK